MSVFKCVVFGLGGTEDLAHLGLRLSGLYWVLDASLLDGFPCLFEARWFVRVLGFSALVLVTSDSISRYATAPSSQTICPQRHPADSIQLTVRR
jgi:hypothetical protein